MLWHCGGVSSKCRNDENLVLHELIMQNQQKEEEEGKLQSRKQSANW